MWVIIEDKRIRHLWECPECNDKVHVQPWWYSHNGTPMCINCPGQDMEYVHTELEIEK